MKCPKCENEKSFRFDGAWEVVAMELHVEIEGKDTYWTEEDSQEGDGYCVKPGSTVKCSKCAHRAPVEAFGEPLFPISEMPNSLPSFTPKFPIDRGPGG